MSNSDSVSRELPNATVVDDELRVPLSDLARYVMRETTPDQLLTGVLQDDTAREMWLEAVGRRYASPGLEDDDRRKLLHLLQSQVHDKALDEAVHSLETLERAARTLIYGDTQRRTFRHWLEAVEDTLRMYPEALQAVKSRNGFSDAFRETPREAERYKLFSNDWNEARKYWRERAERHFTPPPVEEQKKPVYLEGVLF